MGRLCWRAYMSVHIVELYINTKGWLIVSCINWQFGYRVFLKSYRCILSISNFVYKRVCIYNEKKLQDVQKGRRATTYYKINNTIKITKQTSKVQENNILQVKPSPMSFTICPFWFSFLTLSVNACGIKAPCKMIIIIKQSFWYIFLGSMLPQYMALSVS